MRKIWANIHFISKNSLYSFPVQRIFFKFDAEAANHRPARAKGNPNVETNKNSCLIVAFTGLLATPWLGCRRPSAPPPAAARLWVTTQAEPVINRDAAGQSLSVVVRVYQLKDRSAFARLTFQAAAGGGPDPELLDGDFLDRDELVVVPGTVQESARTLHPGARFIGLVALFRRPDPHAWRYLVSVERMRPAQAPPPRDWPWRPWRRRPAGTPPDPRVRFQVRECSLGLPEPAPEPLPGQPANPVPACPQDSEPRP
jgi:type VI secretion system protein VasD